MTERIYGPVREFIDKCVAKGCPTKDFDIVACTDAKDVRKLLHEKLYIMLEEVRELYDHTADARRQLETSGAVDEDTATEIFDALLDIAYVAVFMSTVYNFNFDEGFRRVCENNALKPDSPQAVVVNGKLKKAPDHPKVVLTDLVQNRWGNFIRK